MKLFPAAWADAKQVSLLKAIAVIATACWFVFEWGPWNEGTQPYIISRPMFAYPNLGGVLLASLTAFILSNILQLTGGYLTAYGLTSMPETSEVIYNKLQSRLPTERMQYNKMRKIHQFLLSFTIGTSAVVVLQQLVTGKTGVRFHRPHIHRSSLIVGICTSVLTLAVGCIWLGLRSIPGLQKEADTFFSIATNPLTWIAIFLTINVIGLIKAKLG